MLASFQPARCNSEVFLDSQSNDILLRAYTTQQKLLIGFNSNVDSTISISKSNMSMMKATMLASNMGLGTSTPASNVLLHVAGSTRIEGDLIVNGTVTNMNTDVKVTDQFSVCNNGTGPALVVTQLGAQPIVEFRDDDKVVFKIYDGGFVSIGSNTAETKLDVEGHTTVRGTIYTSNVVTSNVQTNSLTSVLMTNYTTITSNLYSSNLIINNQTIIGSNGIITNSNFLPPFNTSNIVAGQFTSNFFKDDNVISSKLESNLVLKGTTTMSSNVFINNGDLKILGSNNFINVGDQARLYLGSNDYFMASSKNVGLVLQVPGTTYPVIIEDNTGYMGVGMLDPQENIHIGCNAKIEGNIYVMSNLAVGKSNPGKTVDILGTARISDTTTFLDDISILSNNGVWSTQQGRQLYLRYSTNGSDDSAYIQSIDRSTSTMYNMALEGSNIAFGQQNSLANPTLYAQYGGRIGVGTSNPLFAVHVSSNSSTGVTIAIDNSNTTGWTEFSARNNATGATGGMRMGMTGSNFTNSLQYLQNGGFVECDGSNGMSIAATSNSGELRFYTGGRNERVRMTSNGYVGIGLSNPAEMLHVGGRLYTTQQYFGSYYDSATVPSFSFKQYSSTGMHVANPNSIGFSTNGTTRLCISSGGFVGIGNAFLSPSYLLDVSGDIHSSSAFISGSQNGFIKLIGVSNATYIQSGLSNSSNSLAPLIFGNIQNTKEWARFDSNGNFGLGTSSPVVKLNVMGQVNITHTSNDSPSLTLSNDTNAFLHIKGSNTTLLIGVTGSNTFHSTDASRGDVVIKNEQVLPSGKLFLQVGNGVSAIAINSNNNVGIGTANPIAKLHINGDVLANSNIRSSVGTLGPSFTLVPENAYIDVSVGNQVILNSLGEAGNPATDPSKPLFYGSSFLYQDASGEDMKWNSARLLFRGCPLSVSASTSVFNVQDYNNSRNPQFSNLTSNFTLSNDGQSYGYVTYGTPWFGVSTTAARSLALNFVSNSTSSTFRVGQVQIQFKT